MIKEYKTSFGKTIIKVLAHSEKQAKFKIKQKYGFYPDLMIEKQVDVVHHYNMDDAIKNQMAMNYRCVEMVRR